MTRSYDQQDPDRDPPAPPPDGRRSDPDVAPTATHELLRRLGEHGARSSRYELEGEVARGGMGAIMRVWDGDLRRHLAMKVALGRRADVGDGAVPPHVDERVLARFLEEAQVTGQLDHPGIVPVHELGLDSDGRVYFTMKLVRGRDLREMLELVFSGIEGWNEARALGVVLKACEAVAYAHRKGVIHRDLKPANVMVGSYGEVYVMDWGVARVLGRKDAHDIRLAAATGLSSSVRSERSEEREDAPDSPLLTMDGDVMGTPAYMPPEQARGEIEKLSPRSDVYSIGAILYHLLARHMPYVPPEARVSNRTVLGMVIQGPPEPLLDARRDVPGELVAICEKAMARDAQERYPDTLALAADLRAFLEGRVVRAHRTGAVVEFRKWVSRNRATAAASAAALLLAMSALGVISLIQNRAAEATLRQSYVANIVAAQAALRAGECADARRRLDACEKRLRGWEWEHLELESDTSSAILAQLSLRVLAVALSPDGTRAASVGGQAVIHDLAGGRPIELSGHTLDVYCAAFSRDSRTLATGSDDRTIRLWDVNSGASRGVLTGHTKGLLAIAFSPDGSRLASGADDNTIRIWDPETRECLLTLRAHEGSVFSVAFGPDRSCLASSSEDGTVRVWDARSFACLAVLSGHEGAVRSVAFAPDGSRLCSGGADASLRIWDLATRRCVRVLPGHTGAIHSVAFDSTGHRLVSAASDRTIRVWDANRGVLIAVHRGHDGTVRSAAIGPDGSRIVTGSIDGKVLLWDMETTGLTILRGHAAEVCRVRFAPDGSWLATASHDGSIRIWSAGRRSPDLVLRQPGENLLSLACTSDGALLAAGHKSGAITLWSPSSSQPVGILDGQAGQVYALAFEPGGSRLVACSNDRTLRIWDPGRNEVVSELVGPAGRMLAVAWWPDGSRIASGSEQGSLCIWDVATRACLRDLATEEGGLYSLAIGPGGSWIASGHENGTVLLWDASEGIRLRSLRGHHRRVLGIAVSPDGDRLATTSDDRTIRIWDPRNGDCVAVLRDHAATVHALAFSADGKRLAAGGQEVEGKFREGTVHVFESASVASRLGGTEASRASLEDAQLFVESCLDQGLLLEQVVRRLRSDPTLEEGERALALRSVQSMTDDPGELGRESWRTVRSPGDIPLNYLRALRLAERAIRMSPADPRLPGVLGAARFRAGDDAGAIEVLSRLEGSGNARPADFAFLAMALARQGREQEAVLALDRLGALREQTVAVEDDSSRELLIEAGAALDRSRTNPGSSAQPASLR